MDFTKVTNFLNTLADAGVPGTDTGVYLKGKEVYRHRTGYANLESKTLIAPDSIYAFYSMSKVITCTAALRLFEEGRFILTDPVSDYLPEFKNMTVRKAAGKGTVEIIPAKEPIRVAHLFSMSSGLTYNRGEMPSLSKLHANTGGSYTLKEFTRALAADPLFFEPGTRWQYGFSHDVLGCLIETISGMSFGEYLRKHIFEPLGMKDTGFHVPPEKASRLVSCYTFDEETRTNTNLNNQGNYLNLDYKMESGGGGLVSTVDDYALFANALCAGGTAANGYRMLGSAAVELMRTNQLDDVRMKDFDWIQYAGYGYGLGVRTLVDKAAGGSPSSLGEYGWAGAAGTYVVIDPAYELTYVYAQQLMPNLEPYVAPRLRNAIYSCL